MRYSTALLAILLLSGTGLGQWSPDRTFLATDEISFQFEPQYKLDAKPKGKKLLSGGVTIRNLSNRPVRVPMITIRTDDGESYSALASDELGKVWKGSFWGMGMGKSSWQSANVEGQVIPAGHSARYLANFLVPKKIPKRFLIVVEGVGDLEFKR